MGAGQDQGEEEMKKFYARLVDKDTAVLIDGDRIDRDDSFLYVYSGGSLTGVFDRGIILCCYLTEMRKDNG